MALNFLVHVIDEATQHEKKEEGYSVVKGTSEKEEEGDVIRKDAIYLVEAETYIDAIVTVCNMIRVRGSDGELHPVSEEFSKSRSFIENASLEDDAYVMLAKDDYKYVDHMTSHFHEVNCQISHEDAVTGEEWIELHNVQFFVAPQEKIILVKE